MLKHMKLAEIALHNPELIIYLFICNNKNFMKSEFKKQLVLDRILP